MIKAKKQTPRERLAELMALPKEEIVDRLQAALESQKQLLEALNNRTLPSAPMELAKCDTCGCHPSVIYTTQFGRFCQEHARFI